LRIEATGVRTSATALSVLAQSDNPDIAAIDNTAIAPLDVLASAPPEPKSSSGWLMPLLIGIGAVIVLGAGGYLFIRWRRNND
jgi:LPXTG-motif cell wall-anchored protein